MRYMHLTQSISRLPIRRQSNRNSILSPKQILLSVYCLVSQIETKIVVALISSCLYSSSFFSSLSFSFTFSSPNECPRIPGKYILRCCSYQSSYPKSRRILSANSALYALLAAHGLAVGQGLAHFVKGSCGARNRSDAVKEQHCFPSTRIPA